MISYRTQRGFTLIEAIIYLALFSILIGGALVAAYSLFDAATRSGTSTMLSEETDFLLSKIDWALASAKEVTDPGPTDGPESTLRVVKWDTAGPVTVSWNGGDRELFLDGAPLTNTNVEVEHASFTHVVDAGVGITPEYVEAVLTTSARTPNGDVIYRTATTTVYIRR